MGFSDVSLDFSLSLSFGFRFGNHFVYLGPPPPQFNSPLMQVSPVTHGADLWLLPRKPPERLVRRLHRAFVPRPRRITVRRVKTDETK